MSNECGKRCMWKYSQAGIVAIWGWVGRLPTKCVTRVIPNTHTNWVASKLVIRRHTRTTQLDDSQIGWSKGMQSHRSNVDMTMYLQMCFEVLIKLCTSFKLLVNFRPLKQLGWVIILYWQDNGPGLTSFHEMWSQFIITHITTPLSTPKISPMWARCHN